MGRYLPGQGPRLAAATPQRRERYLEGLAMLLAFQF